MSERKNQVLRYYFEKLRHGIFPEMPFEEIESMEDAIEEFESYLEEVKEEKTNSIGERYPFQYLTKEEREEEDNDEYDRFLAYFEKERILDFLLLDKKVNGYSTYDHILGVHYVSLSMARELKKKGIPVDLGIVSAAAACHDIGKYGVRKQDLGRIAYFHYYYSDLWYKRRDLERSRNIAVNHSTWDLELSSLSVESLLLIYADFRVKNDDTGQMSIYPLKDSFDVILNKLDNVDQAKEQRYRRVYNKLVDFETFMHGLGILTLDAHSEVRINPKNLALLRDQAVVDYHKIEGMDESIFIMHLLRSKESIEDLFLMAQSNLDPSMMTIYLKVFKSYHTYLMPSQKDMLLEFLYPLSLHQQEDIRHISAELLGSVIAKYDIIYRKESPADIDQDDMHDALLEKVHELLDFYYDPQKEFTPEKLGWLQDNAFISFSALAKDLPSILDVVSESILKREDPSEVSQCIMRAFIHHDQSLEGFFKPFLQEISATEEKRQLRRWRKMYMLAEDRCDVELMYLRNLKTDTSDAEKVRNLHYLYEHHNNFHFLLHLVNLLKVSSSREAQRIASEMLSREVENLDPAELNDISIDLLRSLELEDERVRMSLPDNLSQLLVKLPEKELLAIFEDILERIKQRETPNGEVLLTLVMKTFTTCHKKGISERVYQSMLDIISTALVITRHNLNQHTLNLITESIYRSEELALEDKVRFFKHTAMKFLLQSKFNEENLETRLVYSLYISGIYDTISFYENLHGPLPYKSFDKIMVVQGTFNPMNLLHREIIAELEAKGYDMYVCISNNKWDHKLAPYKHRVEIANITLARHLETLVFKPDKALDLNKSEDRLWLQDHFGPEVKLNFYDLDFLDTPRMDTTIRQSFIYDWDTAEILDSEAANYMMKYHLYRSLDYKKGDITDNVIHKNEREDGSIVYEFNEDNVAMISPVEQGGRAYLSMEHYRGESYVHDPFQLVANEALYDLYKRGYREVYISGDEPLLVDYLTRQGLKKAGDDYVISLGKPVIFLLDLQSRMTTFYRKNKDIRTCIGKERVAIQQSLNKVYPDQSILFFDRSNFYKSIIDNIERDNAKEKENALCVPIGSLMQNHYLPHNITMSLYIDKLLNVETNEVELREKHFYESLDRQVEYLRSFDKPVIIIDDVLHTGNRLDDVMPRFKRAAIHVKRIGVGLVTDQGLAFAEKWGIDVDYAYHVNEISDWYLESELYPIFGGLVSPRDIQSKGYTLSLNRIMPFVPSLSGAGEREAFKHFSERCIESASVVMGVIEEVFRKNNHRFLSTSELHHVFYDVLLPDIYERIPGDMPVQEVYRHLRAMITRLHRLC